MKVLLISRATLFSDSGGDTVQILNTASHLKKLGLSIDIKLTNEVIDYNQYDLFHFFNIIRPADILKHINKISKPFVISTIFVQYGEYEKLARKGIEGLIFRNLSEDFIEYVKVIARFLVGKDSIQSMQYLWRGHRRSIVKLVNQTSMLLPNSNNEYRRLSSAYNINRAYRPIPNGIDISLFDFDKNMLRQENLVICVGRIEGRKNQLNLIKALSNTEFQLIIIGSAAANQAKYFKECIDAAGENVIFVDNLPQDKLLDYYRKAKVHVLASWFETTGLSSLEAGVMGCNIVITDKGDTKEYFEDLAYYCIPDSIDSIYSAVRAASVNPYKEELRTRIIQNYTWDIAANKTLEAYNIVLGNQ